MTASGYVLNILKYTYIVCFKAMINSFAKLFSDDLYLLYFWHLESGQCDDHTNIHTCIYTYINNSNVSDHNV